MPSIARPLSDDDFRQIIPARNAATVTANDSTDLEPYTRGFMIGVSGNVKVTMLNDDVVTLPNLAAGVIHSIAVKRIWSTGTGSVGTIVAFW